MRVGRQRVGIKLENVRASGHAIDAVLAVFVGDGKSAVIKIDPHARDAEFAFVLNVVAVAILKYFADDEARIAEEPGLHNHAGRSRIGL